MGVIGMQELSRVLLHLSVMIAVNASWLSLGAADGQWICYDCFGLSMKVSVHFCCHSIHLNITVGIIKVCDTFNESLHILLFDILYPNHICGHWWPMLAVQHYGLGLYHPEIQLTSVNLSKGLVTPTFTTVKFWTEINSFQWNHLDRSPHTV